MHAPQREAPQRPRLSRARLATLPLFEGEVCEWGVGDLGFRYTYGFTLAMFLDYTLFILLYVLLQGQSSLGCLH